MTDSFNPPDSDGALDHLAALVRERDRDNYLCALVVPAARRDALLALHAFNSEILRARAGVSEAAIGHVRMKWWYDALVGVFGGAPPHHPVAEALARAVPFGLERTALEDIIEAHAEALGAPAVYDVDSRTARADAELGPLFRQILHLFEVPAPEAKRAAAAARTWGLLTALRREPVPADKVRALHDAACTYRRDAGRPVGAALPALLPMVLADIYLGRIARAGYDLGHPLVRRADPGALALPKLWWAARRR